MLSKEKCLPFVLSAFVLVLDQITKIAVVASIPENGIGASYLDGFLRIVHVKNIAIAFSLGESMPDAVRFLLFSIIPLLLICGIIIYLYRTESLTRYQRWLVCGIVGGGLGNLVDRIFRPDGVIDFVDVKFYGLFGFERWPTFNVADVAIVICGFLLMFTLLKTRKS